MSRVLIELPGALNNYYRLTTRCLAQRGRDNDNVIRSSNESISTRAAYVLLLPVYTSAIDELNNLFLLLRVHAHASGGDDEEKKKIDVVSEQPTSSKTITRGDGGG